jgi:excisionase family DNA binding protein
MTASAGIDRYTPDDDLPELLTAPEFAAAGGFTVGTAYSLVRQGVVPTVRLGRLVRIPKSALKVLR